MPTAVYLSRFVPSLSTAGKYETISPAASFETEIRKRVLKVMGLVRDTWITLPVRPHNIFERTGAYALVGVTRSREPYLLSGLHHAGKKVTIGDFEIFEDGELGEMELGVFSGDSDFVHGVKARMETDLPPWIVAREAEELYVWQMEEVYAIASRRRFLFR